MFGYILNKCDDQELLFLSSKFEKIQSLINRGEIEKANEYLEKIIKEIDNNYDNRYGFKW